MPELPTSAEQLNTDSQEKIEASIPKNDTLQQNESLPRVENFSPVEKEVEVALPPVLQSNSVVANPSGVVSTIPSTYIDKGKRVSKLTNLAINTFRELQRKLALHYQKLKTQGGVR